MSRDLGGKQKWLLALAYSHERRHDGDPAPITKLSEAFFDDDRYFEAFGSWAGASFAKSVLFQTRRCIQALIRRGLMEEAGAAVSETGAGSDNDGDQGPGLYHRKGYTRVCKTYRLTDAGRVIGKAEDEAVMASVQATEAANPELKETADAALKAAEKIKQGERR